MKTKTLFLNLKLLVAIFIIIFTMTTCKKDSNIIDFQTIVPTHYINSETNQEYFIYDAGPDNSSVVIKQISSDTTYNFLLDRLDRVKDAYVSIGGTLDSTLLTFDYNDSVIVISKYSVDWQSGDSKLDKIMTVTKKQLSDIIPEIMNDFPMGNQIKNGQDYFCKTKTSIFVTTVIFGLIGWVICEGNPGCAIIAGLGVGIICAPPANSAEPPPAIFPPNPIIQFNKTFPVIDSDILIEKNWVLQSNFGGESLEFQKNGITSNTSSNFKGTYTLQGNNIKFTYSFCCTSAAIIYQGTNYFIGTLSSDGKHLKGKIYNLHFQEYPFGGFWADGF